MLYNMRLLALSSLVASVFATAKVTPSPTGGHPGIPGSAQLSDDCTLEMVVRWYSPEMASCGSLKVTTMPSCVLNELGDLNKVQLIQDQNYRRCTAVTITVYNAELRRCIVKGGDCDDATEIDVGKYNSTDVKHARMAFEEVEMLKYWQADDDDTKHHRLQGCYTVEDIPVDDVTKKAVFTALKPPEQHGEAWIECNWMEGNGNWTVSALHMAMDKLYLPVDIPNEFFVRLQMLPGLRTLDLSHLGFGLMDKANETQPNGLIYSLNGTLEELILSQNNLETIADVGLGLANLRLLTKLDLHDNRMREVPNEIRKLRNLVYLDLGHNVLSDLPDWGLTPARRLADNDYDVDGGAKSKMFWTKLNNLETLIMKDNNIKFLPDTMGSLRALNNLNLANNMIRHFPAMVAEGLGNTLTMLDLSNNELQDVPNEIGKMKRLVRLDLSNNELRELAPNMGNMDALIWMNLDNNQLYELPDNMWKMESLAYVQANFNDIVFLSDSLATNGPPLTIMELSNNKLKMLPEAIAELPLLYQLNVENNQIMSIPSLSHADRLMYLNIKGNKPLRCLPKLKEGNMWNGPGDKFLTDMANPNMPGATCRGHSDMPTMAPTSPTPQPTCETPSPTPASSAIAAGPSFLALLLAGMMMMLQ